MDGTIKWVNGDRGYGFIEPADGGADIFFSFDVCEPALSGANSPAPGTPVSFQVIDGPRGTEATAVGRATGAPET